MYDYGVYFWSAIVSIGLLAPLVLFVAQEASKAADNLKRHFDGDNPGRPSVNSLPMHSSPSTIG